MRRLPGRFADRSDGLPYLVSGALVASVVALGSVFMPPLLAALLAAALVAIFPEAVLVGAVVALEEQTVAGGSYERADVLVRVGGDQFYWSQVAGLRVVTLVAIVAVAAILLRRRPTWASLRGADLRLVAGMIALTVVVAFAGTGNLFGSLTAASPWVVLGCGLLAGRQLAGSGPLRRQVSLLVASVLAAKAVLGIFLFVSGRTIFDPNGFLAIVYYDSALPMLAGSVLLSLLVSRRQRLSTAALLVAVAAAVIMVVAMRRTTVFAVFATAAIIPVLSRRWRAFGRLAAGGTAAALAVGLLVPGAAASLTDGVSNAWATIRGDDAESSTEGHLEDIRVGWEYVLSAPVTGLGFSEEPPAGLVTSESAGRLYVHNEFLQNWLQLGVLGVLLSGAFVVLLAARAVRVLRRGADPAVSTAAVFCLALPVNLIWFPHLSTTFRWPILVGVAAGILFAPRSTEAPVLARPVGARR